MSDTTFRVINVQEAAELLGISTQSVYRLCRSGELPARKVGQHWRFSLEKLKAFIEDTDQRVPKEAATG